MYDFRSGEDYGHCGSLNVFVGDHVDYCTGREEDTDDGKEVVFIVLS